jgi:hypothetical protein
MNVTMYSKMKVDCNTFDVLLRVEDPDIAFVVVQALAVGNAGMVDSRQAKAKDLKLFY